MTYKNESKNRMRGQEFNFEKYAEYIATVFDHQTLQEIEQDIDVRLKKREIKETDAQSPSTIANELFTLVYAQYSRKSTPQTAPNKTETQPKNTSSTAKDTAVPQKKRIAPWAEE